MTSKLLPSRRGKLILVLFNSANSNDYHRRFVMKVELDGHWDVKAEQNLTLTLTKPLNSNVNSLIWVSIFVVSWLTWIFWAENRWKLVLTFKHIFKGCSSIYLSTGEIEFRIVLSLTGSGFQTLSGSTIPTWGSDCCKTERAKLIVKTDYWVSVWFLIVHDPQRLSMEFTMTREKRRILPPFPLPIQCFS